MGKPRTPSYSPVTALTRGLEVLRIINQLGEATVGALHKATGLDKATIVRMLETLEHEGYVARDPSRSVYVVTGRTLLLSQGYDLHRRVAAQSQPVLDAFRDRIGWPSDIGLRDVDAMLVVQSNREHGPIFFNRKPGFRAPMLVTSLGRAYLAHCDDEERDGILSLLRRESSPWRDMAMDDAWLDGVLSEVRSRGYALMDDRYSDQECGGALWAMAVPVRDERRVYAAVNIMMMRTVVTVDDAVSQFLAPLQEVAARLAATFCEAGTAR